MDREYTLQELRHQYGTGRACHVSGRGKSKVMDYRFGVMTDVGDIELGEWCKMIHALIERARRSADLCLLKGSHSTGMPLAPDSA